VGADDHLLLSEVEREFPAEDASAVTEVVGRTPRVSELLDTVLAQPGTLPPAGFWERREVAKLESALTEAAVAAITPASDRAFATALLSAPAVLGGFSSPHALSPVTLARAFDQWRRGTAQLPGGREALKAIFLDKFASHGGEVRKLEVEAISVAWGKVTGVVAKGGEELGCEHVVAAMPVDGVRRLIPKAPKRLAQIGSEVTAVAYRYTLNLVVAEAGIPEGMGSTAIAIADPSAPLIGANAFAIHLGERDEKARVPVTIEAICPAPGEGSSLDAAFAELRAALRKRLDDVMPFSGEHILVAHSPHERTAPEGVKAPAELQAPARPMPVWRSELPAYLGITAAPYQLGVKRLSLASTQVIPGLGLEGEFEVGWCAARMVDGGSKKRDYLKDEVLASR
jgi:hypothetical protein